MSGCKVCRIWMMVMFGILYLFSDTETSSLFKRRTKCQTGLDSSKIVSSCPTTDDEYEIRAQQMNCESYGNCDGEPVVYHCAINPWGNATVEVCAPETFMTAQYCPHFNTGVGRVLEHHKYPCEECPFNYKSTKGYKYETCKNIMKKKISNVKSHLTTATRNKLPFKKSDLSIGTAFSEAAFRNAEGSSNSRSGSIEIIIAVSGLGSLALLILVIAGAVSYKKGKLLTKKAYPKKRAGKESSKEDSCPEKENCLQKDEEHDKRTIPDNSELLGIS